MSTEKKSEKQKTCVEKKEKCAKFFTSRSLHFVAPADFGWRWQYEKPPGGRRRHKTRLVV
jgi:hypothetical protein